MAKRKLPYKLPKVIRNKSGDWYVQYYYMPPDRPGEWKAFKERKGINYVKDPHEKEAAAEALRKDIELWLKRGNSPFDADIIIKQQIDVKVKEIEAIKQKAKGWTLIDAISAFRSYIKSKGYSDNTIRSYTRYVLAFETWLLNNGYGQHIASAFNEVDLENFLNEEFEENDWSERTFNNYLGFYSTFFTKVEKLERRVNRKIKYEIQTGYIEEKITRPQKNKAYTPVLVDKIKKELNKPAFADLRDYIEWIYLSLMRPAEIRNLKYKDIDADNRQIRILGKTGDRIIPISDQLLDLIKRRGILEVSDAEAFVFGYSGKVSSDRMGPEFFRKQYSDIKRKLKIDDLYSLYSWKHTAVIRMIRAGFKDEEVRVLSGHKTQAAFEAYKRDLVVDNSHVMKGSTIDF